MVHWGWVVAALFAGVFIGLFLFALFSVSGKETKDDE